MIILDLVLKVRYKMNFLPLINRTYIVIVITKQQKNQKFAILGIFEKPLVKYLSSRKNFTF